MTQHEKLMFICSDDKTKSDMETLLPFMLLFVQLQYLRKHYDKPANKIIQCRHLVYHQLAELLVLSSASRQTAKQADSVTFWDVALHL